MRLWSFAFLTAILSVQQLAHLPSVYFVLSGIFVFLGFKAVSQKFSQPWLAVLISGLVFGFAWSLGYAHLMMAQRLLPQYEGVDLVLEGQIVSLPISSAYSSAKSANNQTTYQHRWRFNQQRVRFDFRPVKVISPKSIELKHFPQKIRLSWYRPKVQVKAGQVWRFTLRLKRPYALMNPGGFDYEKYLYQNRIQARGYVRNSVNNHLVTGESSSNIISSIILEVRQSILQKLSFKQRLTNKAENDALFIRHLSQALVLGYRGGLDATQWLVFQRTGTIHLMAISGLHIGLIAGLVYAFASFFWRLTGSGCRLIPAPQVAAIAALVAAFVYAMLAGFTIPTQRALIMLAVTMIHIVFKRTPMPASKTIALALILVLLLDPLAVLAQGFWLSFLAVSVIIFLMRQSNSDNLVTENSAPDNTQLFGFFKRLKSLLVGVKQFARIQWALTVVMFPVLLFFYQASSLVSPLANFIAIPVMSLAVVPLMFIATGLLYLNNTLASLVFDLINVIFSGLWQFLQALASWQYAMLGGSIVSPWIIVTSFLAIALWLTVKGTPMRWLAIILLLPAVLSARPGFADGEVGVTILDVGQGLSVVVQTKSHTLVFDTGARYSDSFDMGRAVIAPYLGYMGTKRIDTLIVSHGDNDHIGGFASVATLFDIKRVLTSIPERFRDTNLNILACNEGQSWQYDGVVFTILSPASLNTSTNSNGHDENNQSCVLKITTKFGRILIAGDIERETESYLYRTMAGKLAADVLVVPHHGSNTSSLAGFIKAVNPDYAVFTVGYKNRYKLPNKQVMKRYRALSKAKLYLSHETGALSFHLQADSSLKPVRYRDLVRRYWHTKASN